MTRTNRFASFFTLASVATFSFSFSLGVLPSSLTGMQGSSAYAQTDVAPSVPYIGIVTQEGVEARASAGKPFYPVGKMRAGQPVYVRQVLYNWMRVDCPPDVNSYVSKVRVDLRGDGTIGVVNTDETSIKVAKANGTAGESYQRHFQLDSGDTVEIIAEEGAFYRIVPPTGASVFLPPDSVRPATQAELAELQRQAAETEGGEVAAESKNEAETTATTEDAEEVAEVEEVIAPAEVEDDSATVTAIADSDDADAPVLTFAGAKDIDIEEAIALPGDGATAKSETETEVVAVDEAMAEEGSDDALAVGNEVAQVIDEDGTQTAAEDNLIQEAAANGNEFQTGAEAAAAADGVASEVATETASELGGEADVDDEEIVTVPGRSMAMAKLERRMLQLFLRDVEDQPIDEMIQAYQDLAKDPSITPQDRRLIGIRLLALERNKQLQETLAQIAEARETKPEPTVVEEPGAVTYDAIGMLMVSTVYDGRSLPLLYRLADPKTQRTLAYVEPGEGDTIRGSIGKMVGVTGRVEYDASVKKNIITVQRIDHLEATEE